MDLDELFVDFGNPSVISSLGKKLESDRIFRVFLNVYMGNDINSGFIEELDYFFPFNNKNSELKDKIEELNRISSSEKINSETSDIQDKEQSII